MTTLNTDHEAMWVAREIQQMMEENGMDVHKKRSRDDHGRRIINVRAADKSTKVKVTEVDDDRSEIDLTFAGKQVAEIVQRKFGGTGSGVINADRGRPTRDTGYRNDDDDDERRRREEENRRRRRSGSGSGRMGDENFKEMTAMSVNSDGSVVMMPPFTKEEASYEDRERSSRKCENCVHYLVGGGCAMVQGEIDPQAHCDNFYADVGLFGSNKGEDTLNLKLWGEEYDFTQFDINRLINQVQDALEEKSEDNGSI